MGTYRYTSLSADIPAIPIAQLELIQPGKFESPAVVGQGILDTGSDCTLVPIPWLMQINAQVADKALRIPVCGQLSLAIPHEVGIRFVGEAYRR
jgi:hypothetical protein